MCGVAGFVVAYIVAAARYPGGTRTAPGREGYSFVQNYWCDLLDATSRGGRPNPGQPVALAGMLCLCAGLAVFWWSIPRLFAGAQRRAWLARVAGVGSGLVTPWVATTAHDVVIRVASLLGVLGFVSTATALGTRGGRALAVLAWAALAAALTNYAMWETRIALDAMALVQKAAFALFLAWVVAAANLLRQTARPEGGATLRSRR